MRDFSRELPLLRDTNLFLSPSHTLPKNACKIAIQASRHCSLAPTIHYILRMPSIALQNWHTNRLRTLDEIEQAHRAVGGIGRGRRYATQQINHAYTVLLSSQFQGFCRDLHTECIDAVVRVSPP